MFNLKGINSTSAKKRKKSSKQSKHRDDSGSRVRFRDKQDKTLEFSSAVNTYQNSVGRKDHSPLSFLNYDRIGADEEENLVDIIHDSMIIKDQIKNIEKGLKKKIMNMDTTRSNTEKSPKGTDRFDSEFDEKKLQIFIESLGDLAELHPASAKLFVLLKEGLDDSLQRIISRKKFDNIKQNIQL